MKDQKTSYLIVIALFVALIILISWVTQSPNAPQFAMSVESGTQLPRVDHPDCAQCHDVGCPVCPTPVPTLAPTSTPVQWDTVIENATFTNTLRPSSNTLIQNVIIHSTDGNGIYLRGVENVHIRNCEIFDVDYGILLSSLESTANVTIENCEIHDTALSGIHSGQRIDTGVDHPGLIVRGNTLYNNGNSEHQHGLYIQSQESLVEGNVIWGSSGNCLSVRSTGTFRYNTMSDCAKSCFRYYSDHAPGSSMTVNVYGNSCVLDSAGVDGSPGFSLLYKFDMLADYYYFYNNTATINTSRRCGFQVQSEEFDPKFVSVVDNVFVNTKKSTNGLCLGYIDHNEGNGE